MSKKKKTQSNKNFLKKNKLLLIFLFIYIVLSFLFFDLKLFTGGDNAVYIILAESIVSGKGYKNIHMPDEPEHTQYPFGLPLLISLFLLIFGSSVSAVKLLIFLTGCGSMYFMYKITKHLFKDRTTIIMLFYLSIPIFIIYNHWILSEIPFLFFSLGTLYFFIKAQENKNIFYYISFVFATYSFFIRTAGISLIIAMIFFLLIKKQFKLLGIFLLIFLAIFIPWQIRNASIPIEGSYIDKLLAKNPYRMELGRVSLFDLLTRVWNNFILYAFTILPMTLLPIFKTGVLLALSGFVFIVLTIIGIVKKTKKITAIGLYFIFGVIILLAWPKVWSSDRFLLPILPILILYIFSGISWLGEKIKSKYFIPVVIGVLILLNIIEIVPLAKNSVANNSAYLKGDKYAGYTADWKRYFEIIELIEKNIPEDKIIMARKPEFVYLLSRRKSFIYPITSDHTKIKDAIARSDYIIFDSFYWTGTTKRVLLPVLQEDPSLYEVIYKTKKPEFYLLKVKKD